MGIMITIDLVEAQEPYDRPLTGMEEIDEIYETEGWGVER
ncbi:hypothetical protein QY97_01789 [Bacillus thermotolerans]|uniref:Uncharacterized protein n=1 Tax=Bacillus thermotolerans TaxID=1221996 RepID=A0A0F5I092_BACTR|nr:hypothetical protein QY97_01789 [Bacillus thermotolerans]KKB41424.1 hypothetical protein QY95_00743 [Bacillus thermotolerans]KKB43975.1 hypothetical protein QY96_00167 [Bacillus thermotolerans]